MPGPMPGHMPMVLAVARGACLPALMLFLVARSLWLSFGDTQQVCSLARVELH